MLSLCRLIACKHDWLHNCLLCNLTLLKRKPAKNPTFKLHRDKKWSNDFYRSMDTWLGQLEMNIRKKMWSAQYPVPKESRTEMCQSHGSEQIRCMSMFEKWKFIWINQKSFYSIMDGVVQSMHCMKNVKTWSFNDLMLSIEKSPSLCVNLP